MDLKTKSWAPRKFIGDSGRNGLTVSHKTVKENDISQKNEISRGFWNPKQKVKPLNIVDPNHRQQISEEQRKQQYVQQQQQNIFNDIYQSQRQMPTTQSLKEPNVRDIKNEFPPKSSFDISSRIGGFFPSFPTSRSVSSKFDQSSNSKINNFILKTRSGIQTSPYESLPQANQIRNGIQSQQSFPGTAPSNGTLRVPCLTQIFPDPTKTPEVMSRVLISNSKIGAVIGKGGAIVKHIRECAGARITINDFGEDSSYSGNTPNSGERMIHIGGSFLPVCSAFGAILAHAETPSNGEALPRTEFLVKSGLLSGELLNSIDGVLNIASSSYRILVPTIRAGALIGLQGNTIKTIREMSGARIEISSNCMVSSPHSSGQNFASPDRIVSVAGSFFSCIRAHYLITACLIDPGLVHIPHLNQIPDFLPNSNIRGHVVKNRMSPPGKSASVSTRSAVYSSDSAHMNSLKTFSYDEFCNSANRHVGFNNSQPLKTMSYENAFQISSNLTHLSNDSFSKNFYNERDSRTMSLSKSASGNFDIPENPEVAIESHFKYESDIANFNYSNTFQSYSSTPFPPPFVPETPTSEMRSFLPKANPTNFFLFPCDDDSLSRSIANLDIK